MWWQRASSSYPIKVFLTLLSAFGSRQKEALATDLLLLAAWGQVGLGVATLVNCVPVHLGSAHQAGALTLFSVVLLALHTCRVPPAGQLAARLVATTPAAAPVAAVASVAALALAAPAAVAASWPKPLEQ